MAMTDDELIAKADEHVRWLEAHFKDKVPKVSAYHLAKRRVGAVRQVVDVFFEGDDEREKIIVSLNYLTGECLGTKFLPLKGEGAQNGATSNES
jgi:hypothetical protein